jgi:predicted DNA-binding protein
MINLEFSENVQNRLIALSQELHRNVNELVEEAVLDYLADYEDLQEAEARLANPPKRYLNLAQVEKDVVHIY